MLNRLARYRAHGTYCGHETPEELALEGLPLASFKQRALSHLVDFVAIGVIVLALFGCVALWQHYVQGKALVNIAFDSGEYDHESDIIVLVLYHGLFNYFANGRTPGKWVAGTRVVSLTGARLGRWQSIERALGYGAAMLEFGLGFAQIFWSANRMCAQDRLAETIVINTRAR